MLFDIVIEIVTAMIYISLSMQQRSHLSKDFFYLMFMHSFLSSISGIS